MFKASSFWLATTLILAACSLTAAAELPDAPQPATLQAATTPAPAPPPAAATATIDAGPCIVEPNQPTVPLTFHIRTVCLVHRTFTIGAIVSPAIGAAVEMARPPDHYPREWKDGAEAFGRNYGDRAARHAASGLANFTIAAIDREDPRYHASANPEFAHRVFHALIFSVVDQSQSGHRTLALSNFAGASAAGFVGIAYLPHGYNDVTHGYQHSATEFVSFAGQNLISEFYPEFVRLAHKLHLPTPKP